jgi:hypothetical protein
MFVLVLSVCEEQILEIFISPFFNSFVSKGLTMKRAKISLSAKVILEPPIIEGLN